MYCRKCGKEIPNDSIYCPICGTNTNISDNEKVKFTKPVSKYLCYGKIIQNNNVPKFMLAIPFIVGIVFLILSVNTMFQTGSIMSGFSIIFAIGFIITASSIVLKARNINKAIKSKEIKSITGDEIYALVTNKHEMQTMKNTRYSITYEYMYDDEHYQVIQEILKKENYQKININDVIVITASNEGAYYNENYQF